MTSVDSKVLVVVPVHKEFLYAQVTYDAEEKRDKLSLPSMNTEGLKAMQRAYRKLIDDHKLPILGGREMTVDKYTIRICNLIDEPCIYKSKELKKVRLFSREYLNLIKHYPGLDTELRTLT